MTINSRIKGATAERELAGLIFDWTGVKLTRNLEQTRDGGYDLTLCKNDTSNRVAEVFGQLAIEVKRYREVKPSKLITWWDQAVKQALASNKLPVLAYRADRRDWRVIVPLSLINSDLSNSYSMMNTAELSLPAFCSIVRDSSG